MPELMRLLKPDTVEAPGNGAEVVAARWIALSAEERARTGIYASGRQMRREINAEVQRLRMKAGELGTAPARLREGVTLVVDDRTRLKQQAGMRSGEKTAASEVARGAASVDRQDANEALPERSLELTMEGGGRSRGIEFSL